jgi:hypothetical protein
MKTAIVRRVLGPILILLASAACGGGSVAAPLDPGDLNLVLVVSPDLAFQSPGDLHPDTGNLTGQGLRRSLLLAEFLKQQVLGGHNVNGIHALSPMTHLQTAGRYPDMAPLAFVQQFSVLNQTTQILATGGAFTGNNVPINVAYSPGTLPAGVAAPASYCPDCNGLVFADATGANLALVSRIISSNRSGYFVLSAPWETVSALLAELNHRYGDALEVPLRFQGSNLVYALTLPAAGGPRLTTFASAAAPEAAYPVLPAPVPILASTSTRQAAFSTSRSGGVAGALVPANSNRNQKIHIIRHAEAHPDPATQFEDGNLVGAGQWRALALPAALEGKLQPDLVCSVDPAQW